MTCVSRPPAIGGLVSLRAKRALDTRSVTLGSLVWLSAGVLDSARRSDFIYTIMVPGSVGFSAAEAGSRRPFSFPSTRPPLPQSANVRATLVYRLTVGFPVRVGRG